MSIMSETYYLGHDDEIRDQDILDRVVRELCKVNLNPSVSVNTKKEDYQLHEGIDHYTSEIKITYDSKKIQPYIQNKSLIQNEINKLPIVDVN